MGWRWSIIIVATFGVGCGAKKSLPPSATAPTKKLITRLAPEQILKKLSKALDVKLGWKDGQGIFHDDLTEVYAVPLGGVDFVTASKRDLSTKVQTLLSVRRVAWDAANTLIWTEANLSDEKKTIFTECKFNQDRPLSGPASGQATEGEARWKAQLVLLYQRIYSRSPSEAEVETIRTAFISLMANENSTVSALA